MSKSLELIECDEALEIEINQLAIEVNTWRGTLPALMHRCADAGDKIAARTALGAFVLPACATEDIIRLINRASSARRRGLIDDPAQLTFALTGDGITPRIAPAQKRVHNEVMEATTKIHAVRLYLREMADKVPVSQWDVAMKQAIKADLEPLVEMWRTL